MKLSVIIVNYNVRHFLEQCLHSVQKASSGLETEVFVVDNASVDGSCHVIREKFPKVKLIENQKNFGFSFANNQAIRKSSGEFILLLNPDTLVEEDTFIKTVRFMEEHPDAGGLGVKMIDGNGKFLPESKRGLPTPWVAFYHIFGLSALFPHSKKFGKYHLTYLNKDETHPVDILCGAFMMLRRTTLDKTGLLDESFFMYGEDIDLSYRIIKSGFKNYYFPGTTIIHYKGESTKKDSINYVRVFYNAMIIFARKHFSAGNAGFFSFFIHLAIWVRAFVAVFRRILHKIYLPVLDALLIYAGMAILLPVWEEIRYEPGYYPPLYMKWIIPAYIVFWLTGIQFSGGYRSPVNLYRVERGLLWGAVALLLAYSLIPEGLRFSRLMIIGGSAWALVILPLFRILLSRLKIKGFELDLERSKRVAIAGCASEIDRVKEMLNLFPVKPVIAGYVSLPGSGTGDDFLGSIDQIKDIVRINRIEEVIFCSQHLRSTEIIRAMLELADQNVDIKIAPPESLSIIGSHSTLTAGELYPVDINAISRYRNRLMKRGFDMAAALLLLMFFWIFLWFFKGKKQLLKNIWQVLTGKLTWVGYLPDKESEPELPFLRKGVLNPGLLFPSSHLTTHLRRQINILYAKDYRIWNDLEITARNWKKLDSDIHG